MRPKGGRGKAGEGRTSCTVTLSSALSVPYHKGSPDGVECPVECGELLVRGARDHTVGKREGIESDSLGPSVVLKHSCKKGFGGNSSRLLVSLGE